MDFGVTLVRDADSTLTRTGQLVGTIVACRSYIGSSWQLYFACYMNQDAREAHGSFTSTTALG